MRRTVTAVAAALTAGAFTLAIMFGAPKPANTQASAPVAQVAVSR